jgi:hypothetical protein
LRKINRALFKKKKTLFGIIDSQVTYASSDMVSESNLTKLLVGAVNNIKLVA